MYCFLKIIESISRRKHGDANNEPDPKHIDIISDNKDQQNKNMLRDEEIKQNSFSNNRK